MSLTNIYVGLTLSEDLSWHTTKLLLFVLTNCWGYYDVHYSLAFQLLQMASLYVTGLIPIVPKYGIHIWWKTYWILNEFSIVPPSTFWMITPVPASSYKTWLIKHRFYPLMDLFELHDILFAIKSIKLHTNQFMYISFSSALCQQQTHILPHYLNKITRHFCFHRLLFSWNSMPVLDLSMPFYLNWIWKSICGIT